MSIKLFQHQARRLYNFHIENSLKNNNIITNETQKCCIKNEKK